MRFLIKYKPEIHSKLCDYLDKEVKQDQKYQQEGIANKTGLLKQRSVTVAGRTIDITKSLRDKVDMMVTHSFYYEIKQVGDITITFGSLVDRLPHITVALQKRLMLFKVKAELRKEFGDSILEIKKEG